YARLNPDNFLHKVLLLQANQLVTEQEPIEKVYPCFRAAIDDAKSHGFIQYQALGNEMLARYFIARDMGELAEPYLREARFLYHSWGCEVKVQLLTSTYASIWNNNRIPTSRSFSQTESLSSELETSLDLASIMKSAQAISSELEMGKLAIKVLNVIVESVGATIAGFVTLQDKQPRIIVYVDDQGTQVFEPGVALSESQLLPGDLVSYVLRSREVINLGDALGENAFLSDPYIMSRQPRSILALPVNYRDELMGVLYLENTLTLNAFTEGRLDVVNLLVAQAAISFENARLFEQINRINLNLEYQVDIRTRELAQANQKLNQVVQDLKRSNSELDAFSRSVSHDLRAPLRKIRGFIKILQENYGTQLDDMGNDLLARTINSSMKMTELIEGLLELSRVQKQTVVPIEIDLSELVKNLFAEMEERFPGHRVVTLCESGCRIMGDQRLIYSALENLVNNAWKYTLKTADAKVEFGRNVLTETIQPTGLGEYPKVLPAGTHIYFIKDNGAGFDTARAEGLFTSFQRFHRDKEFEGTGIGLSTVKRIFEKHGGYIWAQASLGEGATFYFVLPHDPAPRE
ncbi:MAG: ATP-binding protein, partial [Pseudomonadales bacterium]|nr:ATP-binding protein [Pseudomonadales bacterium]